jgi:hypothetical protein
MLKFTSLSSWGLYYKTYYGCNLWNFVIRVFVPGKPVQPSQIFVDKARGLPKSRAPESFFTQVGSSLTLKNFDLAGEACQGQTL